MSESILAWHFVGDKLRNGDPVPPDGEWLEWAGSIVMCESGLHASRDPWDALRYAPGPILCRVECAGTIIEESDKLVCSHRRIVERRDATDGLRYFARSQALSVVHLWEPPEVVLDFLMGDIALQAAARNAAGAARNAAWAARYAAGAAAWAAGAARYAAGAARYAAGAARNAAGAAAWAAWAARYAAGAARYEWNLLVNEAFGIDAAKKARG